MVKASAGITDDDPAAEAFEKLRICCESEAVADLLGVALGVLGAADDATPSTETSWAALRWAEQLADAQPLVLVFEDVQWADERMLDVIEHLARSLRDVPVADRLRRADRAARGARHLGRRQPARLGDRARSRCSEPESAELADDAAPGRRDTRSASCTRSRARRGQPSLPRGDSAHAARGRRQRAHRPHPRQRPGPDRARASTSCRRDQKRLLQHAAVIGRVFWRGALERLAPDARRGRPARRSLRPRLRSRVTSARPFRATAPTSSRTCLSAMSPTPA